MANPIEYGLLGPWRGRNGAPSLSGYISSGKKNDDQRESDSRYSATKRDAIKGAMQSGAVGAGLRATASGIGGLLSGADMTIGDLLGSGISPSTAMGLAGNVTNAAFGLPDSFGYKVAGFAAPAIGAMLGGPAGGLLGGTLGGLAYDKALDAFDARDMEDTLDAMESAYGSFSGYNAIDKAMDFARSLQSPAASLNLAESIQAQTNIPYTVNMVRPSMTRQPTVKGWSDTVFGSLPQTQGWAEKQDRMAAAAAAQKAAEDKAYNDMISSLADQVYGGTFGLGGSSGSSGGVNSSGARGSMGAGSDKGESKGRGLGGR